MNYRLINKSVVKDINRFANKLLTIQDLENYNDDLGEVITSFNLKFTGRFVLVNYKQFLFGPIDSFDRNMHIDIIQNHCNEHNYKLDQFLLENDLIWGYSSYIDKYMLFISGMNVVTFNLNKFINKVNADKIYDMTGNELITLFNKDS